MFSLVLTVCAVIYVCLTGASFVYEVASPTNKGTVIFFSDIDFGGEPPLTVLVRDYDNSGRKPLFVEFVNDGERGPDFAGAVWSGDNSLFVVNIWSQRKLGPDQIVPAFGYDFQNHIKVTPEVIGQLL